MARISGVDLPFIATVILRPAHTNTRTDKANADFVYDPDPVSSELFCIPDLLEWSRPASEQE